MTVHNRDIQAAAQNGYARLRHCFIAAFLVAMLLTDTAHGATITWDGSCVAGGDRSWNAECIVNMEFRTNWNNNGFPTLADDVVISAVSGEVLLDNPFEARVNTINVASGLRIKTSDLSGLRLLSTSQPSTINNLVIEKVGTTPNFTGGEVIVSHELTLTGNPTIEFGGIREADSTTATLINAPSSIFDLKGQQPDPFPNTFLAVSNFTNQGTVHQTGPFSTFTNLTINNTNLWSVQSDGFTGGDEFAFGGGVTSVLVNHPGAIFEMTGSKTVNMDLALINQATGSVLVKEGTLVLLREGNEHQGGSLGIGPGAEVIIAEADPFFSIPAATFKWTDGTITLEGETSLFTNNGTMTIELPPVVAALPTSLQVDGSLPLQAGATIPTLTGKGKFINHGSFEQFFNFRTDGPDLVNQPLNIAPGVLLPGEYLIITGDLSIGPNGANAKFINHGKLIKPARPNTADSNFDVIYDGQAGSKIEVWKKKLTLRGGGTFRGTNGLIDLTSGATLSLASRDANRKVYQVLSGNQTAVGAGNMVVGDNATLSMAFGAQFVNELDRGTPVGDFQLEGTGLIEVGGKFFNLSKFTWKGGRIRTLLVGEFVNAFDGDLAITGTATKTLAGELVNFGNVEQFEDFTVDDGKIQNKDLAIWTVRAGDIKKGSAGGEFRNTGLLSTLSFRPVANETMKIEVRLDNTGFVEVGQALNFPNASAKVILSDVKQVMGNALTGGSWFVQDKGVLDFEGKTIKQIGNPTGADATVLLRRGGTIERFELEEIRKTGSLSILENQSVTLPGALTNRGNLTLNLSGAKLQVNGDLDQFGTLFVGSGTSPATTPQILVLDGNVTFHKGSKTTIDGQLNVIALLSDKRIEVKGKLNGVGTINGSTNGVTVSLLAVRKGATISPGRSIGVLTVNADYTQDAEASLFIEIDDTGHDQLVVNGTATVGGTVLVDFLDNFVPTAGTTFDAVSATTFIDDNFNLALLSGGLVEASVAGMPGSGQPLRLTAIDGKRYLGAGGPWDSSADWTGGTVPDAGDTAFIPGNAMTDTTVTGPAGDTTVTALVVGSGADPSNSTTMLALGGGVINATRGTTLRTGGGLTGNGTIAGNLYNAGRVAPGQSPDHSIGILEILGSFSQGASGVLDLEIGGLLAGGEYDQLLLSSGTGTLNGTLRLSFVDGFAPKTNDNFFLIDGSVVDNFAAVEIFGLKPGFQFQTQVDASGFLLTALNDGVLVPEPDTLFLLACGLLGLYGVALRRRPRAVLIRLLVL